jgi:hypothetical protein
VKHFSALIENSQVGWQFLRMNLAVCPALGHLPFLAHRAKACAVSLDGQAFRSYTCSRLRQTIERDRHPTQDQSANIQFKRDELASLRVRPSVPVWFFRLFAGRLLSPT